MPDFVAGNLSYPGLPPFISFSYSCSHGITPGIAVVRTQTATDLPDGFGDLVWTDGYRTVTLPDCRISKFTAERSGDTGIEWVFEFEDERWRWRMGSTDGCYNRLDPHAKLLPRTVRSPTELVHLLLDDGGWPRANRIVNMPTGISVADLPAVPDFLPAGVNFPPLGINPEVSWYAENPWTALARLADSCGRRVVYDPINRFVLVVPPDWGGGLPNGSIHTESPSLVLPPAPDIVRVVGDPTRFQPMLQLYGVALEYNGMYVPKDEVSYAPTIPGQPQVITLTPSGPFPAPIATFYGFWVTPPFGFGPNQNFGAACSPGDTAASLCVKLANNFNTNAGLGLKGKVVATAVGGTVVLTGTVDGYNFTAAGKDFHITAAVTQVGSPGKRGWDQSEPPLFPGIVATNRLTLNQARALAQKSVFKTYRITGVDVDGKSGIVVPGYARERVYRADILILDGQCEQVVPDPGNARFEDENGDPLFQSLYDGYSRDKPGAVFGSIARFITNGSWFVGDGTVNGGRGADGVNTAPTDQVYIDFSVETDWQAITFSDYIYKYDSGGAIKEAQLFLYTACQVRHKDDQQFEAFTDQLVIRDGPVIHIARRPDAQLNVIGDYQYTQRSSNGGLEKVDSWTLINTRILEADPLLRADYYLNAELLKFQFKGGEHVEYNGIQPIQMDGQLQQATYEIVGGVGVRTVVGLNLEPDVYVVPYFARRRAEDLAPVARAVPPGLRQNPADSSPGGTR